MQAGDILLAVNASAIDAVPLDGITQLVCGAEGSSVLLKMLCTSHKQAAAPTTYTQNPEPGTLNLEPSRRRPF